MTFLTLCLVWGQQQPCPCRGVGLAFHRTWASWSISCKMDSWSLTSPPPTASPRKQSTEPTQGLLAGSVTSQELPLLLWDTGLPLVPTGKWAFCSCGLGSCGSGVCSSPAPSLLSVSMTHGMVAGTAVSGEEWSSSRETCHSAAGDSCTFPHPRAGPNFTLGASTSGEPEKKCKWNNHQE